MIELVITELLQPLDVPYDCLCGKVRSQVKTGSQTGINLSSSCTAAGRVLVGLIRVIACEVMGKAISVL